LQQTGTTQSIVSGFERQMENCGRNTLLKSLSTITKRLDEHYLKLAEYIEAGGTTSSVEREIATFQKQINAINQVLSGR